MDSYRTALALWEARVVNFAVLLFCFLKCRFIFTRLSNGEKQLAHRRQAAVPRTHGLISHHHHNQEPKLDARTLPAAQCQLYKIIWENRTCTHRYSTCAGLEGREKTDKAACRKQRTGNGRLACWRTLAVRQNGRLCVGHRRCWHSDKSACVNMMWTLYDRERERET
jgi:hypothetical protein